MLYGVEVASLEEVQGLLNDGITLIEYYVTEDRTLAFIITRDSFETVPIEVRRADLARTIITFHDFANLEKAPPQSLVQLYRWLIEPLQLYLTTPTLSIVPHSVLHYVPFAALTDGQSYLIEDYNLFCLPSASLLKHLPAKEKQDADNLLVLGNPQAEGLRDLRFAAKEAETIAQLYGFRPYIGQQATESLFKAKAGEYSVIHLAVHGQLNPYNPLFSSLRLAAGDGEDGRLEVHEIYSLDLIQADLVTLSACETQLGELSAGDEVVGLNRAFLYAGTPSVIASLWTVDDKATGLLMERFYTHLRAGMGKAEALRQSQIDVQARYPHPYYWAAFVLTGDPGEMSGYKPPAREIATPSPAAEVKVPVEEMPKADRKSAPMRGCCLPCPVGTLILALGMRVAFTTNRQQFSF